MVSWGFWFPLSNRYEPIIVVLVRDNVGTVYY